MSLQLVVYNFINDKRRLGKNTINMARPNTPILERRSRVRSGRSDGSLEFSIPGINLCIPLDHVEKVLPIMDHQVVPNCPDYFLGFINYRGKSVPIIDLSLRLGRPQPEYSLDTPLILCNVEGICGGLLVEQIQGVGSLDNLQRHLTDVFNTANMPFLAVFGQGTNLRFMLDAVTILDLSLQTSSLNLDTPVEQFIAQSVEE